MLDLLGRSVALVPKAMKAVPQHIRLPLCLRLPATPYLFSLPALLRSRWGRSAATLALTVLSALVLTVGTQTGGFVLAPLPKPVASPESKPLVSPDSVAAPATPAPATAERSTTAPTSRGPRLETRGRQMTFEETFILSAAEPAQASQQATGVPASVTIAQAILESDWGRSGLTVKAKNYFGIKARPDPGPAGVVYMNTWESIGGANVTMNEPFRAYNTMEESFVDHGKFLSERSLYRAAFKYTNDAKQFAREIHKAGYATDPGYSAKLIALMDKFSLYDFDLK